MMPCTLMCVICDNPRAAELMNHSGSSANKFCRMCMVCCYISIIHCRLFIIIGR